MHRKGYLQRGTKVVVHKYSERTHGFKRSVGIVKKPFEVHFFPGLGKLFAVGHAPF